MPRNILPHLAMSAVAIIYGLNYSIAKDVLNKEFMTPSGFILLRVIAGTILFFLFHALFIKEKMDKKDLPYAALCGVFGVGINMLCFFEGLKFTSPIHASLIMVLTPIIVLVLSSLIIKEKITRFKAVGIFLGLLGAGILVFQSSSPATQTASIYGDAMILVNAISYGFYLVLVKRLLKKYQPITVVKWVFLFGTLLVIPFGGNDLYHTDWSAFTPGVWWAVVYVLIGVTFFAYFLNAFALSRVQPSTVGFYVYFQPLIASAFAIMIGMDMIDSAKILAAILLFAGVFSINYKRREA